MSDNGSDYRSQLLSLGTICAVEAGCDEASVKEIPARLEQAVKEIKQCLKEIAK